MFETAIAVAGAGSARDVAINYFCLGRSRYLTQRYCEAFDAYRSAAEIDPSYALARQGWADALIAAHGDKSHTCLAMHQLAAALETSISRMSDDVPSALFSLGRTYAAIGMQGKAAEIYRRVVDHPRTQDKKRKEAAEQIKQLGFGPERS